MSAATLPEQVVRGAMSHMNADHQHNLLDYARVQGGLDWATTAIMTALDAKGFELDVQGEGRQEACRIEFPEPVTDGKSLRVTLVKMAKEAQGNNKIELVAVAKVPTPKAARYLRTLVVHFNQKVEASYEDNNGHVAFPFGDCKLLADDDVLTLTVSAESDVMLERTQQVVADHLFRFSGKEALTAKWQAPAGH